MKSKTKVTLAGAALLSLLLGGAGLWIWGAYLVWLPLAPLSAGAMLIYAAKSLASE